MLSEESDQWKQISYFRNSYTVLMVDNFEPAPNQEASHATPAAL
jgi:hypothetical protein